MHVLLITPYYPPLQGGAATYSSIIAQHFQHEPDFGRLFILTEQVPSTPKQEHMGAVTIVRALARRDSNPKLSSLGRQLTSIYGLLQVVRCVRQLNVDLVHWHGAAIARARELFASRFKLCPVLLDVRDTLLPLERMRGYDHYIASTGNVLEYLQRALVPPESITYIPVPFTIPTIPTNTTVRLAQQRYHIPHDEPYILFVGDLSRQKGVAELLDAFRMFRGSDHDRTQLVIIGLDRTGGALPALIGRQDAAHYLGQVPRDDVLALIRGAKCVVLPAQGEALSRVILEAIAFQTPVVCPPGVPEFDRHCPDFVLNEISPQAIARKIAEVLERGQVARYPFELHTTERSMLALGNVYKQMAEQRGM
jgi:glycosyltransferase involved in cell wall biosynthesis